LAGIAEVEIPDRLLDERGYAIDAIIDANHVLRGKKVAIFGDPDKVIALTEFAFEMGMRVVAVLSPIKTKHFAREIERIANANDAKIVVFENSDLYQLHKFIKQNPIHLLIGDYRGRYIASAERIPLLRVGFPVCDRFGYTESQCLDTAEL
jgi:nitrogenase molybdenum-iron protein beta chain